MFQVQVELKERSYPIFIGSESLSQMLEKTLGLLRAWSHAIVIVDSRIAETHGAFVEGELKSHGKRTTLLTVPSGEESKSVHELSRLWTEMLVAKADRKSVVIAVGGGVIGDLAGFAASAFTRGLRFVQVPTTLLAMVDSSVGGKTGINLPAAKNMIGAFWQPHAVCIDTRLLLSLPTREYISGLAEVVKYGVILDSDFFEYLERYAQEILDRRSEQVETIVRRSCELKAQVVALDEFETTGLRAILNYGHTFGHAIEAKTSYGKFLHGEAVSIGMTMAGRLASIMSLWPDECLSRQTQLLSRMGLPTTFAGVSAAELMEAMQMDKKTEHGKLNFILPKKIGYVETVSKSTPQEIVAAIDATLP